jgi:hypothetical protein
VTRILFVINSTLSVSFSPSNYNSYITSCDKADMFLNTKLFYKHSWWVKSSFIELFHKYQFHLAVGAIGGAVG